LHQKLQADSKLQHYTTLHHTTLLQHTLYTHTLHYMTFCTTHYTTQHCVHYTELLWLTQTALYTTPHSPPHGMTL